MKKCIAYSAVLWFFVFYFWMLVWGAGDITEFIRRPFSVCKAGRNWKKRWRHKSRGKIVGEKKLLFNFGRYSRLAFIPVTIRLYLLKSWASQETRRYIFKKYLWFWIWNADHVTRRRAVRATPSSDWVSALLLASVVWRGLHLIRLTFVASCSI